MNGDTHEAVFYPTVILIVEDGEVVDGKIDWSDSFYQTIDGDGNEDYGTSPASLAAIKVADESLLKAITSAHVRQAIGLAPFKAPR